MRPLFLLLGSLCALTGIAFGAFGAHGLKNTVSPEMLTVYQTGVTYQMYHALGLVALALSGRQSAGSRLLRWAGVLMFSGIILFSGSLYLLSILDLKWLGMITPFGGVCFLTAWLLIAIFAARAIRASANENRY